MTDFAIPQHERLTALSPDSLILNKIAFQIGQISVAIVLDSLIPTEFAIQTVEDSVAIVLELHLLIEVLILRVGNLKPPVPQSGILTVFPVVIIEVEFPCIFG